MSRAFANEDAPERPSRRRFDLPAPDDPQFDAAAARELLEAAREGDTGAAEDATGYRWGEPRLHNYVSVILEQARIEGDERLEQLAQRFLR